jgi:tetratricopeptide (TPR) repeat protein
MRLGNAFLHKGDLQHAEYYTQDALRLARQNQHPRLEADAALTLASIRDRQGGQWKEETALAREALKYFEDFGFADEAADASTLIVRGEQGEGNLAEARKDSIELVRIAQQANSKIPLEYAEDTAAWVSFNQEDFPDALKHYEHALEVSRMLNENVEAQQISCANLLWRLGRYSDTEAALNEIPEEARARPDTAPYFEGAEAAMRLSQGRYREAIEISTRELSKRHDIGTDRSEYFRQVRALAEGRLGQSKLAYIDADQLLRLGRDNSDDGVISQANLVTAELLVRDNQSEKALPLLEVANQYFSKTGMRESEWRSFFLLAKAARATGDNINCSRHATKALDILKTLEQSWGSSTFAQYSSRPDNQTEMRELSHLI